MRHILILAAAAVPLMLAGCASENSSSYGTSGITGTSQQTVSPNEPGMGQGMSRKSLNNAAPAGSGSTGMTYDNRAVSPNEPGMDQGMTRKSLNNSSRAGSGSSGMAYDNNETVSPNEPGMGQGMTRKSLPNTAGKSSSSSW